MANEKGTVDFGQTLTQKTLYFILPVLFSLVIVFLGPYMTGVAGTILFIALGLILGVVTFFISSGWGYKLVVTPSEIKINDKRVAITIPLDKIGAVVKNGGFPFPTLWILIRGGGVGNDIPAKGVDPQTRELIAAYQKRNPGKALTYVPVPGGNIRSVADFVRELKGRIPPLTVDERLGVK